MPQPKASVHFALPPQDAIPWRRCSRASNFQTRLNLLLRFHPRGPRTATCSTQLSDAAVCARFRYGIGLKASRTLDSANASIARTLFGPSGAGDRVFGGFVDLRLIDFLDAIESVDLGERLVGAQ